MAASLVQGVFALERDRQENRNGDQALGPPWWQFFNFRLVQNLVDQVDASHFGAVYEFINFPKMGDVLRPPQFVIAFRGTSNRFANWEQDLNLNLLLSLDTIQSSSRVRRGLESAHRFVRQAGPENVWLAGHSIGSSLALGVGRQMAKQGHHLETYLFNPPFSSPPIERLTSSQLKFGLRLANSLLTAALAAAAAAGQADTFSELSAWFPYLFINPSDPICSEYVGYFKHREHMESIGAGEIERLATKHSKRSIVLSAAGEKDCEPVHRIPSAHLILNHTPSNSFKEAHGIHQWWRQDLQFHYTYHRYK